MIELEFGKFCNQDYESEEYHQLYVMLNGEADTLYVGISRRNIWERWFGFSGHMIYERGRFLGLSPVGRKIEDHLPDSLKWKIQLWTREDCVNFCKDLLPKTRRKLDIEYIEPFMIQKLSPILNVIYNLNPGKDTTPKSEKELKWERYVDKAYDEIFNKKES